MKASSLIIFILCTPALDPQIAYSAVLKWNNLTMADKNKDICITIYIDIIELKQKTMLVVICGSFLLSDQLLKLSKS